MEVNRQSIGLSTLCVTKLLLVLFLTVGITFLIGSIFFSPSYANYEAAGWLVAHNYIGSY
jgi:hypothetical protein